MVYTYVIGSKKDNRWYTGTTSDLRKRLQEHNDGKVASTKNRCPFELIYYEGCIDMNDAFNRERYLKTGPLEIRHRRCLALPSARISNGAGMGKRYLKNRLTPLETFGQSTKSKVSLTGLRRFLSLTG